MSLCNFSVFFLFLHVTTQVNASELFALAEKRTGIPNQVLHSLCLTESGRHINGKWLAHPYTLNIDGKGFYFSSVSETLAKIKAYQATPELTFKQKWLIDVGMCQINLYWHRDNIPLNDQSIKALLRPSVNLGYASNYLLSLWKKNKSLKIAVGKYHSPSSSSLATKYRVRVSNVLEQLEDK